jgi:hypothetical protein
LPFVWQTPTESNAAREAAASHLVNISDEMWKEIQNAQFKDKDQNKR